MNASRAVTATVVALAVAGLTACGAADVSPTSGASSRTPASPRSASASSASSASPVAATPAATPAAVASRPVAIKACSLVTKADFSFLPHAAKSPGSSDNVCMYVNSQEGDATVDLIVQSQTTTVEQADSFYGSDRFASIVWFAGKGVTGRKVSGVGDTAWVFTRPRSRNSGTGYDVEAVFDGVRLSLKWDGNDTVGFSGPRAKAAELAPLIALMKKVGTRLPTT